MSTDPLPVGKLDPEFLAALLGSRDITDPRVLLGPGIGCDVAVLVFGDRCLVAKSDPVTFATDEVGWYAVNVNANDIACSGARPRWFLATVLLPENATTPDLVTTILAQIRDACDEIGASLIGGHTEVTFGIDRPIISGQMLGEVDRDQLVLPTGICAGDAILMTKGIAVEGASILARELAGRLTDRGCSEAELAEAAEYLFSPGISVVRDAQTLTSAVCVHAMHDPTEGGLATGIWEMAEAGGVGIDVEGDRIQRLPHSERFCTALGLDPLGLIASGTLLAAVAPDDVLGAYDACAEAGIDCTQIGVATEHPGVVRIDSPAGWVPLSRFDQDELTRAFSEGV